jgi:hypothetical protein
MSDRYTAKIYFNRDETEQKSGHDVDELYNWMLMKTQGAFGNFHGEIIDNKTKKVVKAFRKAPPD